MRTVYTCPKCKTKLQYSMLASNPPQHRYDCPGCGWFVIQRARVAVMPYPQQSQFQAAADTIKKSCFSCDNWTIWCKRTECYGFNLWKPKSVEANLINKDMQECKSCVHHAVCFYLKEGTNCPGMFELIEESKTDR